MAVEVNANPAGNEVRVRAEGGTLRVPFDDWKNFTDGVKKGEFDWGTMTRPGAFNEPEWRVSRTDAILAHNAAAAKKDAKERNARTRTDDKEKSDG